SGLRPGQRRRAARRDPEGALRRAALRVGGIAWLVCAARRRENDPGQGRRAGTAGTGLRYATGERPPRRGGGGTGGEARETETRRARDGDGGARAGTHVAAAGSRVAVV